MPTYSTRASSARVDAPRASVTPTVDAIYSSHNMHLLQSTRALQPPNQPPSTELSGKQPKLHFANPSAPVSLLSSLTAPLSHTLTPFAFPAPTPTQAVDLHLPHHTPSSSPPLTSSSLVAAPAAASLAAASFLSSRPHTSHLTRSARPAALAPHTQTSASSSSSSSVVASSHTPLSAPLPSAHLPYSDLSSARDLNITTTNTNNNATTHISADAYSRFSSASARSSPTRTHASTVVPALAHTGSLSHLHLYVGTTLPGPSPHTYTAIPGKTSYFKIPAPKSRRSVEIRVEITLTDVRPAGTGAGAGMGAGTGVSDNLAMEIWLSSKMQYGYPGCRVDGTHTSYAAMHGGGTRAVARQVKGGMDAYLTLYCRRGCNVRITHTSNSASAVTAAIAARVHARTQRPATSHGGMSARGNTGTGTGTGTGMGTGGRGTAGEQLGMALTHALAGNSGGNSENASRFGNSWETGANSGIQFGTGSVDFSSDTLGMGMGMGVGVGVGGETSGDEPKPWAIAAELSTNGGPSARTLVRRKLDMLRSDERVYQAFSASVRATAQRLRAEEREREKAAGVDVRAAARVERQWREKMRRERAGGMESGRAKTDMGSSLGAGTGLSGNGDGTSGERVSGVMDDCLPLPTVRDDNFNDDDDNNDNQRMSTSATGPFNTDIATMNREPTLSIRVTDDAADDSEDFPEDTISGPTPVPVPVPVPAVLRSKSPIRPSTAALLSTPTPTLALPTSTPARVPTTVLISTPASVSTRGRGSNAARGTATTAAGTGMAADVGAGGNMGGVAAQQHNLSVLVPLLRDTTVAESAAERQARAREYNARVQLTHDIARQRQVEEQEALETATLLKHRMHEAQVKLAQDTYAAALRTHLQRSWLVLVFYCLAMRQIRERTLRIAEIRARRKTTLMAVVLIQRFIRRKLIKKRRQRALERALRLKALVGFLTLAVQANKRDRAADVIQTILKQKQEQQRTDTLSKAIRSYRRKVVSLQRGWRSTLACRAAKMELWRRQWHKYEEEELKGPCGLQPSTIQELLQVEFQLELTRAAADMDAYADRLAQFRAEKQRLSNTRILLGTVGSVGIPPVRPHVRVILGRAWIARAIEEGTRIERERMTKGLINGMGMGMGGMGMGAMGMGARRNRRGSVVGIPPLQRRGSVVAGATAAASAAATSHRSGTNSSNSSGGVAAVMGAAGLGGRRGSVAGPLPSLPRRGSVVGGDSYRPPSGALSPKGFKGGFGGGRRGSVMLPPQSPRSPRHTKIWDKK